MKKNILITDSNENKIKIPKIIHYIWVGGEMPVEVFNAIKEWKKILYDYEFMEWSENNFDVNKSDFCKEAMSKKKYAFVSDYIRLEVLVEYGGIYLDTDVIIKKKFDDILFYDLFLGKMYESALGTAVIGSVKGNIDLVLILENYKNNVYTLMCPNNVNFTNYFREKYSLDMSKKSIIFNNIAIFDRFTFENPSFFHNSGYSIHLFSGSWYDKPVRNCFFKAAQFFVRRSHILFYLERLIRTRK